MSKGARNRAKRAKEAEHAASRKVARDAIGELLFVESFEQYVDFLEKHPELGTATTAAELREASGTPGYGPLFKRARVLLDGAGSANPEAAWTAYRKAADEAQQRVDALDPLHIEADAAMEAGNYTRVLECVDQMLPVAFEAGFGALVCSLLDQRGVALLNSARTERADDLDAAIEAFQTALDVAAPGVQAAGVLMHLGLVFCERIHGDRADNIEAGIEALRAALVELEGSDDEDEDTEELRAMVLTNLSVALGRSEMDDRAAVVREAVALCREALKIRSIEKDADDWAYSQLNLGEALRNLSEIEGGEAIEARAAFQAVVDNAGEIKDRGLIGFAHQALGRIEFSSTRQSAEDVVEEHEAGTLDDKQNPIPALRTARDHLESACGLISDPIRHARALVTLSYVLADLDESDGAINAARAALAVLRPTIAPDGCKEAGWQLGSLLADRGDWQGAAAAMRDAVEAAEFVFHARFNTASREREVRSTGNLYRWAAYAIARSGDAEGAAVVLDAGRAREIGRRLASDTALAGITDELRADFRAAVETLASTPIGSDMAGSSRELQRVVKAIREIPGHERFGAGPGWDELTGALEPGWPLIYVNPAPTGTLLLVLSVKENAGCSAEARFIDATSMDVYLRLLVGDRAAPGASDDDGPSYLFNLGASEQRDLGSALDQLLPWLGETLGRPIADELHALDAAGATLVLCGPLGLSPLHAAPWQSDMGLRCLADEFDIRFAPSAVVCAASLQRAGQTRSPRLVALADPQGDLPAARPEVVEIAAQFDTGSIDVAVGNGADVHFLRRHAGRATHLHLACHARGGLFDATEAAISLASGLIPATELTTVARLQARLVVVSACESALSEVSGLPDEVVSIGTALIASGSACAIASLWSVDDLATALLMTRLYQEMLGARQRPPEALRRAQLWLRDLTEEDERLFLERHGSLAREFARRSQSDRREPGQRETRTHGDASVRPYVHPEYWAPFVAVGV